MDATTRYSTQVVGALPVLTKYFDEIHLGETIDHVVPWEGEVPLGTLVEIMVANRALNPKAMYKVGEWAAEAGVADYYGLDPNLLNDDRFGRALERLPEYAPTITAALVSWAVNRFELNVGQIHYDITNVELYGNYEKQLARLAEELGIEAESAATAILSACRPAYGRTKSGRKNVKQVGLGLNVTNDGGVPVGHLPLDGNTAEVSTHIENLKLLDQVLPKGNLLVYLADSKLDSEENLLSIKARGGRFLCAGVFSQEMQERYLGLRRKLRKLNYYPESQAKLPAAERDQYKVVETTETIRGEVDGRRQKLTYRQIFVWSEAKARQKKATRERHMGKIREEFETVERNLNKYSLTTREVIVRRLESAKARYSEGELFEYELHQRQGRFSLKWRIDPKKLQRREHLEGAFLLKTNLSASRHSPTKVLTTYRQQSKVEQGHRYLKGPLAVSPTYLEKPERIAGLLCILVWALMVLRLMERNVRRELNGEPLYGLYPENRPCLRPTIPAILECFSTVSIVIVKHRGTVTRRLAEFTPIQHRLIRLMGIPPDGLRSFKRRCAT